MFFNHTKYNKGREKSVQIGNFTFTVYIITKPNFPNTTRDFSQVFFFFLYSLSRKPLLFLRYALADGNGLSPNASRSLQFS